MGAVKMQKMQRKRFAIGGVVVAGIAILVITAIYTPIIEYDPRIATEPAGIRAASSAQIVEEFLRRSGRLPLAGTGLVRRDGRLEWEVATESAVRITDLVVWRVQLTSGAPLLRSVLDDDPTYAAEVDVTVTTSDGQETNLRVRLWDYGLLTPWSLLSSGDGLKPGQVCWNQLC
jgi:hypothetical protein